MAVAPMEMEDGGMNGSASPLYKGGKAAGGFFISTTKAIVLLLLAVAACVAVGLIVHFASPKPEVIDGGSGDKTTSAPPVDKTTAAPGGETTAASAAPGDKTTKAPDATTAAPVVTTAPPKPTYPPHIRLPLDLEPTRYEVHLQPYLEDSDAPKNFTFDGTVTVHLNVLNPTKVIKLHINEMTIDDSSISLVDDKDAPVPTGQWNHDEARQFFELPVSTELTQGVTYKLTISYTGILNDDLVGFYRSSYLRKDGTRQYLATTQFQPTDARRAFPCMDEPGIKSVFKITIKCLKKYTAISNSPEESNKEDGDFRITTFKDTPKMSTYLVAFVVSDFKFKESKTKNNVRVRVWAREDALDTVDYALNAGVKVLEHFGEFFQEPFPLEKQDMIAVPDFNAGAMENWGLVTYRETALLFDPKDSSISNMQRVALVVSHELAHQWFGNLVTPKWWNDLWLNEGFASFVENIGIDYVEPDLKIMQQFVTGELQPTLVADSITSSHPISLPVSHPDQINELFDSISYGKGASVIRMMDFFLKRANLQNGLQQYLEKYKFNNTESDDLWAELTEAVKNDPDRVIDVKKVMDTWTLQMGFPVVTVDNKGTTATATQDRFLLSGSSDPKESPFGYKWEIPFTYTTKTKKEWNSTQSKIEWMHKDGTELSISGLTQDDWIIGNVEQMGYYRVNYNAENWGLIISQLTTGHKDISVQNRAQLLDDAFNLARANELLYETALDLTAYLKDEDSYLPWAAAMNGLNFVSNILSQTSSYGKYMNYMLKTAKPNYDALGFATVKGEDPWKTYLRSTIVGVMCSSGHQDCLDKSKQALMDWKAAAKGNPGLANPIDLNLRQQIYCYGIAAGDKDLWQFMFEQYKKEDVAAEKKRLLGSLACSTEPWILRNLLKMSIEEGGPIRRQDATSVINWVARKDIGNPIAWEFIRSEWATLRAQFGSTMSFARVILAVSTNFSDDWKLNELQTFMKDHPDLGSASRGFSQAVDKTKANIEWLTENQKSVDAWLEKHQ